MEHFRWQLTTSGSDRTVVPSQDDMFMKALDSIWEISVKVTNVKELPTRDTPCLTDLECLILRTHRNGGRQTETEVRTSR